MMHRLKQWTSKQRLIAMVGSLAVLALATLVLVDMPMRAEQAQQRQEAIQWQKDEDALKIPSKPKAIPVPTAINKIIQHYPSLEFTTETLTPNKIILSGTGGYVDLYKALQALEKQLPHATWSSLAIAQSDDFKKTRMSLTISTSPEGKKP